MSASTSPMWLTWDGVSFQEDLSAKVHNPWVPVLRGDKEPGPVNHGSCSILLVAKAQQLRPLLLRTPHLSSLSFVPMASAEPTEGQQVCLRFFRDGSLSVDWVALEETTSRSLLRVLLY